MLEIGKKLPTVELQDDNGELVAIHKLEGHISVIYFYPKDETPGCTAEACGFRDEYESFEALGAKVFGVSGDSVRSHQKFKSRHRLNFSLLSDKERIAEKAFGVPRSLLGLLPGRVTFIADKKGIIRHTFTSAFHARQHVREALKFVEENLSS
ncbi:MAG: peroxiredoxin [Cyclobacteriaceae bacterium]|nr:peroxiredoxin [Cyclobacteriaceae bacterium HetDA_MAG_MS6]